MSLEKSPDGGEAARDSALVHRGDHLIQGQIRLLGYQSQQPIRALLQRRRTPSARLCPGASSLAPALKPPHRRTGAEPVVFGSLTPRRPGFHGFDNTLSQVVRIRLRHRFGPQTPNQCLQTRLPKDTWESPRFNHAGMCSKTHREDALLVPNVGHPRYDSHCVIREGHPMLAIAFHPLLRNDPATILEVDL